MLPAGGVSAPPSGSLKEGNEKFFRGDKKTLAGQRESTKQLIKYMLIAVLVIVVLIVFALMQNNAKVITADTHHDEPADIGLHKKQAQKHKEEQKHTEQRYQQLQTVVATLKKQRDEAIAKAEKEKRLSQNLEKKTADKAVAEKNPVETSKWVEAVRHRVRKAEQAEGKVREKTAQLRRETKKLEQQRHIMTLRLEEEWQLKKQLEQERAQELDKLEAQRLALENNTAQAVLRADEARKAEKRMTKKVTNCSDAAAKFKTGCR